MLTSQPTSDLASIEQTTCCVVGGGPAGAMLAYLLARQGISVLLLEAHHDFERDFRGDTLHPSTLEVLDDLGLADQVLQLPHSKMRRQATPGPNGLIVVADFGRLRSKFPFVVQLPQVQFLGMLVGEAQRFPNFGLRMGARVEELIEEEGLVRGVRYRGRDGWHEVRAALVIGADGRFSRLRRLADLKANPSAPPMDVLWFRLPHHPDDLQEVLWRFGRGQYLVQLDRGDEWQLGFVIAKGTYNEVRAAGLETLRRTIVELAPEFADRVGELRDWKQVSTLNVAADRLLRWYKPGLLLIGDAAHVMSPVGGNGINYAIMDAVAAANLLAEPLRSGRVTVADLARVQRRRELPTRAIQSITNIIQERMVKRALDPQSSLSLPALDRVPLVREVPPRLFGYGIQRERVRGTAHPATWQPAALPWLGGALAVVLGGQLMRWLLRRARGARS